MDLALRSRKDIWTRVLFVLVAVVAWLLLAAWAPQSARAELVDSNENAIETSTPAAEETTVAEPADAASVVEQVEQSPLAVADVVGARSPVARSLPPVVAEVMELVGDLAVGNAPAGGTLLPVAPVVDPVLEAAEEAPLAADEVSEVVAPVEEVSEAAPPAADVVIDVMAVEELSEAAPELDDVVGISSLVAEGVDAVRSFPSDMVDSSELIEAPDGPATPATGEPNPALVGVPAPTLPPRPGGGLGRQIAAELAVVDTAALTGGSGAGGAAVPDEEQRSLGAYLPIARSQPAPEPAGDANGSGTAASSGGTGLGAFHPYGVLAALAALLALLVFGWIRDRSRSGRSFYPSLGGRPG